MFIVIKVQDVFLIATVEKKLSVASVKSTANVVNKSIFVVKTA